MCECEKKPLPCKDLLEEVIKELKSTPERRSSNEVPKIPSTSGSTGDDVPSRSSGVSAPPPSCVNASIQEVHRHLFGYNPRFIILTTIVLD